MTKIKPPGDAGDGRLPCKNVPDVPEKFPWGTLVELFRCVNRFLRVEKCQERGKLTPRPQSLFNISTITSDPLPLIFMWEFPCESQASLSGLLFVLTQVWITFMKRD